MIAGVQDRLYLSSSASPVPAAWPGACSGNKALEVGEGQLQTSAELVLILLAETVSSREEIPAPFLVHLPDIRLLGLRGQESFGHVSEASAAC